MTNRPAFVMETLLALHHASRPQSVLCLLLDQLTPEYGPAAAWCYLFDPAAEAFRLVPVEQAASGARRAGRPELPLPRTLAVTALAPALGKLAGADAPVTMTDHLPGFLVELCGGERGAEIERSLAPRWYAVAPVCAAGAGPVGVIVLAVQEGWPEDVAAECTAHAAAAIARMTERRGAAPTAGLDPESGLATREAFERLAVRELDRAERYRRILSLAVVDLPEAERTPAGWANAAALVRRVMRRPDSAGRLSEGRIVVLLPETPSGGAAVFLRRLRARAGEAATTLCCASATYPQDGRTLEELEVTAAARFEAPDSPSVPGGVLRGALRGAFPTFTRP